MKVMFFAFTISSLIAMLLRLIENKTVIIVLLIIGSTSLIISFILLKYIVVFIFSNIIAVTITT